MYFDTAPQAPKPKLKTNTRTVATVSEPCGRTGIGRGSC